MTRHERREQLAALWREDLDSRGQDPREELAFHHELEHLALTLERNRGRSFKPGGASPA